MARRRQRALTTTFAIVSMAAMSLLGVALVVTQTQFMRQQALDDAVRTATAYVQAGINDRVPLEEWRSEELSTGSSRALTGNLRTTGDLLEIRVYGRSGRVLFPVVTSSQSVFPDTVRLDQALGQGQSDE